MEVGTDERIMMMAHRWARNKIGNVRSIQSPSRGLCYRVPVAAKTTTVPPQFVADVSQQLDVARHVRVLEGVEPHSEMLNRLTEIEAIDIERRIVHVGDAVRLDSNARIDELTPPS